MITKKSAMERLAININVTLSLGNQPNIVIITNKFPEKND